MSRQIGAQIRICTENQEIEKLMGIPKASSRLENKDLRTRIKWRGKKTTTSSAVRESLEPGRQRGWFNHK